jgi:hypothetical protein
MRNRDAWRGPNVQLLHDAHAVVRSYIRGFYESDASELAQVFHPSAHLYFSDNEGPKAMAVATYLDVVRSRDPITVEQRLEEIHSISFVGANVAVARLQVENAANYFEDCLTLIHDGNRWRVMSKTYSARPKH